MCTKNSNSNLAAERSSLRIVSKVVRVSTVKVTLSLRSPVLLCTVSLSDHTQPFFTCSLLDHVFFIILQAPESLLESLETHLNTLEGKKP